MTSSRPLICMFLLKLSETDSMRVVRGPDVHKWGLCLQPNTVQGDWHLPEICTVLLQTLKTDFHSFYILCLNLQDYGCVSLSIVNLCQHLTLNMHPHNHVYTRVRTVCIPTDTERNLVLYGVGMVESKLRPALGKRGRGLLFLFYTFIS